MNRRHLRAVALVGLVLLGAIGPAVVADLLATEPQVPYDGGGDGIVVGTANGPQISLLGSENVSNPADGTGNGITTLNTTAGNITFASTAEASATIAPADITGDWTNLSNIDARGTLLKATAEDKQTVGVGGHADHLNISDTIAADDNSVDLAYGGSSGETRLYIPGLSANSWYKLIDQSGTVLVVAQTDSSGALSVVVPNSDHTVRIQSADALDVAVQHTDDTDFNNAQTLTNLSVDGSGQSASVVGTDLAQNGSIHDDMNDGDSSEYSDPDNSWAVTSSGAIFEGSHVMASDTGSFDATYSTSGLNSYPDQGENFSVRVLNDGDNTDSQVLFGTTDAENTYVVGFESGSGTGEFLLRKRVSGSGSGLTSVNGLSIPSNEWLEIETKWETDGTITATLLYGNGTAITTISAQDTSHTDGGLGFRGDGRFDYYVESEQSGFTTGQYISQNVSADNVQGVAINRTLGNATMNASVDEWTGSQWQTVAWLNDTNSSTTNTTVDVSGASNNKFRLDLNFSGEAGTTTAELHDTTYLFKSRNPDPQNATADPQGNPDLSTQDINLSLVVEDPDLATAQDDSVDVEFQTKNPNQNSFSTATTNTITSNTTTSHVISADIGGGWEWRVKTNDTYGNTVTSETFEFRVPAEVDIRNETNVSQVINNVEVTGQFYSDDTIEINTTADGSLNFTNKPVPTEEDPLILVLEAGGYHTRAVIIDNIYANQSVYMINNTGVVATNEIQFVLDDTTGEFPPESTLTIQRPINHTDLPDGSNDTEWTDIAGDQFGEDGFVVDLETEQRLRLILENREGDSRIVGPFTPTTSKTVTVQPAALGINVTNSSDSYIFNATLTNTTTQAAEFSFVDPTGGTTNLEVQVCEQANPNDCFSNVSAAGPLGQFKATIMLNDSETRKNYIVTWSADRGGKQISGQAVIGASRVEQIPGLADRWRYSIAALVTILTGGLFSQLNRETGAIVTGLTLGGFYVFQWLPAAAGVPIAIAITGAVIYKTSKAQGGILPQ